MRTHWLALTALALSLAMGGCGGSSSSLDASAAPAENKHVVPRRKEVVADYQGIVQALYIAYFGRPADPTGLASFESALLAAGAPTDIQTFATAYATNPAIAALIDSFGTSKESQGLYGTGDATAFVNAVFLNVLGRAPQAQGLSYWVNSITSGSLGQGDAALSILAGALSNNSAQGLIDAQLVNNRLAAATSFTASITTPASLSSYSGASAAQTVRTMLSSVTSTTDLGAFQTTIYSTLATLVASNSTSFPLNAAITAFYESPQSLNSSSEDAAGNTYTMNYTSSAGNNTTFNGQAVQTTNVNVTIAENGTTLANQSSVLYYQTAPFKMIAEVIAGGQNLVAANQSDLPAFASLGASGNFYSETGYTNSSMSSIAETIATTWSLTASPTAGTAYLCANSVVTLANGSSSPSASCYQTDIDGNVSGSKTTLVLNGATLTFNATSASVNQVTIPTPASQGCNASGGTGYQGVSFVTTSTGNSGYFAESSNYAAHEATDSFTYGLSFDNSSDPSTAFTADLRVQLWALPTSYNGTSQIGYLLASFSPNLTGAGAYSSNQLDNFFSTTSIVSQGTADNPPIGTYCVAALLQEALGNCGSSDGYCTIDWRNVINPQTYY